MRYHIYHSQTIFKCRHDWDVDEDFVRRMIKAYLRGELEATINGQTYSVGSELFLIYEISEMEGSLKVFADSLVQLEAIRSNYSKDFFEKKFNNVTDQFLFGRSWGELSVNYFNIFISDGEDKTILTLNEEEVHHFLNTWAVGDSPIWTNGERIDLNDPTSIKIFDIEFKWLQKDRGKIKVDIKKHARLLHKGRYTVALLEEFGKEITDRWNVKPFGKSKPKSIDFNWHIIHPEIARVAKGRFNPPHYADAVEAAFKELNDVIKKECFKLTGKEDDGTKLMRLAFGGDKPPVKLTDLSTESLRNIQEGYGHIFAGAIIGIRNPKAHSNLDIDEQDAWEKIVLASHLMKMWDGREK